jgi:hypothetical protein
MFSQWVNVPNNRSIEPFVPIHASKRRNRMHGMLASFLGDNLVTNMLRGRGSGLALWRSSIRPPPELQGVATASIGC